MTTSVDTTESSAAALVADGEALRAAGRLADARRCLFAALDLLDADADADADTDLRGRAVLALGGLWLNEIRPVDQAARLRDATRRAAASIVDPVLRARLALRVAAEAHYQRGESDLGAELAAVRRLGDQPALAEALGLQYHTLLSPQHVEARRAVAEELLAVAGASGPGVQQLVALCWYTVDCFLAGDPRAPGALARLLERDAETPCVAVGFVAAAMTTMQLIRRGAFDDALASAVECNRLGTLSGDPDAAAWFFGHIGTIHWCQGREAELAAASAAAAAEDAELHHADRSLAAVAGLFALRAGDPAPARQLLDAFVAGVVPHPSSSSLLALVAAAEAAAELGHVGAGRVIGELLAPYAGLPAMGSLAVLCVGPVDRGIGLAASACGDLDVAVTWLERARRRCFELGNAPVAAITQVELARVRWRRDHVGDRALAVEALDAAIESATQLAMPGWRERWQRLRASWVRPDVPRFIAVGEAAWQISYADETVVVRDRVGVRYLARLCADPGVAIAAARLAWQVTPAGLSRQPHLDNEARRAVNERLRVIDVELERPRARTDPQLHQRLLAERAALAEIAEAADDSSSPVRSFAMAGERARTAVRKAITRALDDIEVVGPQTAAHLRAAVTTGAMCVYGPAGDRQLLGVHRGDSRQ